jgi:N-acylneuraminate cytidylyltransferase
VGALALMHNSRLDYCFPVTEYPSSIQRALKLLNNCKIKPFYPEFEITRTQDLEPAYYDAGQFYWGASDLWLTNPNIHKSALGFSIPNWRVVDIDTAHDWKRAELLYSAAVNKHDI